MANKFPPNAVCHSHSLMGSKILIIKFLRFLTNMSGITSKSKQTEKYLDLLSAIRPAPHSEELPIPKPPENLTYSY